MPGSFGPRRNWLLDPAGFEPGEMKMPNRTLRYLLIVCAAKRAQSFNEQEERRRENQNMEWRQKGVGHISKMND